MTVCDVTKEWNGGLDREIVFHDMPMGERLLFYPPEKIVFLRTHGVEMGAITNEIVEDDRGELLLRFAFTLEREGMQPDSPEERAFAETYGQGYLVSVQKTIDAIRALVKQGKLKAAPAKRAAAKRAKPQKQARAKATPRKPAKAKRAATRR
jgi:soluble cytochrome b562